MPISIGTRHPILLGSPVNAPEIRVLVVSKLRNRTTRARAVLWYWIGFAFPALLHNQQVPPYRRKNACWLPVLISGMEALQGTVATRISYPPHEPARISLRINQQEEATRLTFPVVQKNSANAVTASSWLSG